MRYIGLIHANHGLKVMDYLSQELRTNSSEVSVYFHLSSRVHARFICVCAGGGGGVVERDLDIIKRRMYRATP